MSTGYTYTGAGLNAAQVPSISIADLTGEPKKLPNHKVTLSIHSAHGGHIVEIKKPAQYGTNNEPELYIIHEDQDFDRELGKIITHFNLKAE